MAHAVSTPLASPARLREELEAGIIPSSTPDPDLAILLTKARQHSVCLVGPGASDLFDPVPQADLSRVLLNTVEQWREPSDWQGDERNVVLAPADQEHAPARNRVISTVWSPGVVMSNVHVLPPLAELAGRVGSALRDRGETVAVAESSAGGLISAALLAVPGASAFFLGGAVVYTRAARKALLDMSDAEASVMRAETEPYASFIGSRIRDLHGATWGLGESGAAGPTGSRYGDAPGHVAIAVVGPAAMTRTKTIETGEANRAANMDVFARQLLLLFDEVLGARPLDPRP